MSVINKMLRDLDARRADGALPELSREVRSATMQGTVSVGATQSRLRLRWLLLSGVVLAAGAAAWYWTTQVPTGVPTPAPAPLAVASVSTVAAAVPQAAASASDGAVSGSAVAVPESAAPVAAAEPVEAVSRASRPSRAVTAGKPEPATAPRAEQEKKPAARADDAPARRGAATRAPALSAEPVPAAPAAPAAQPPALRRQPAVQETLTQAQNLWAAGSREAAVALLREAVAVAERAPDAEAQLPLVVRELARMELAQGRSGAALDLLTRLEPRLAGHSDLWAMRGNAAQRLGRHAESVQAYQRALELRPGEQRWLLGAAVSLAALGQADNAAQYAEQARALGPVSAEVLAYLRQAGVPLR